jgi:ABC-type branched-subunit amino acid transport system substrate-binding protein
MFAVITLARKVQTNLILLMSAFWLVACDPLATGGPSVNTSRAVQVALLVPMSAPDGGVNLASSLENAARMAMADLQGAKIDLRVYDSGGIPTQASAVTQQAINDGAKIILGPVFAEAANASGVVAADRGINVLAFSNNPSIAGGNVFILGSTFQNTANRLVSYSARSGKGNILIVHGQSPAEEIGKDAISRAIANSGARLAGVTSFELTQQGVVNAVPVIAAEAKSSGADAIFLTSGSDGALPFLADLLPENGIDPLSTQFIGLQRLDIPATALGLSGLQNAIFALPDPALTAQFANRYQSIYGRQPHVLAGLAYDGIAAIGALISTGQSDALTGSSLTRSSGFAGVNGVFRLMPNGTNQRGLAVARVQNKQVVFVDPAPRGFGGTGF